VLVDDIPSYACSVLTHSVKGKLVETVEGLESANGDLHPVQQAFVEELSPQCGYCTPGQVMSAVGLLRANPNPSREEVRQGMAGNICRCGSYDSYLNGVMRAVEIG
jgi:aerobic-type carbon monoxide dehydrogenase small subunit (CoxS/CutS family)